MEPLRLFVIVMTGVTLVVAAAAGIVSAASGRALTAAEETLIRVDVATA